jgi:hypothetical protein
MQCIYKFLAAIKLSDVRIGGFQLPVHNQYLDNSTEIIRALWRLHVSSILASKSLSSYHMTVAMNSGLSFLP